jgi:hypothetical protein
MAKHLLSRCFAPSSVNASRKFTAFNQAAGIPIMAMKKNERYRCVNSKCRCEIEVVKDSSDATSVRNPRCACGQDMKKMY